MTYAFYKTGYYKITVEDTVRSGIDRVVLEMYYVKPAPVITAYGLHDNGYTNEDVWFIWTDEAYAILIVDGVEIAYKAGTILTDNGECSLTFRDYDGHKEVFTFTIDKTVPVIDGASAIRNGYVSAPISLSWQKENCIAELYRNEVLTDYANGDRVAQDGHYILTVTDLAGNIATVEFTLDTVSPTLILDGVENSGSVKGTVILKNLSESATIKVYLNGAEISYRLGDSLTELGTYTVAITDLAGNTTEYNFEILYSLSGSSLLFIILAGSALLGGTIAIIIARKRKKFKAKKGAKK